MRAAIDEWIFRRPLRHLRRAARTDTVRSLGTLHAAGLQIGVFSDYPTRAKVEALGLNRFISLHVCATDTDVNAFKPHPRGFLLACERWSLSPAEVLYVGDRPRTDAIGAGAAGLPCAIIGWRQCPGAHRVRRLADVCAIAAPPSGAGPASAGT
jgi:FMN phosphatase YigB (HAD superfamily)